MNVDNNNKNDRLIISYILCAAWFFGFGGLHRLYNGKIGTGLLWFCTLGLFGIGQFIDVFLIPGMVEERDLQLLRAKAGLSPLGVPLNQAAIASQVYRPNSNHLMVELIKAAESRGGSLTVTQGVKATGASFVQVEGVLKEMLKSGYVRIDNDPINGAVIYHFQELS